jgi:L-alanine-DL-glutamate epimerase-like enolase superfamily enzyme
MLTRVYSMCNPHQTWILLIESRHRDPGYPTINPRHMKVQHDGAVTQCLTLHPQGHTEAVEGTLNGYTARFVGHEADDIEALWQDAWRKSFYRGGPVFMSALAGIDIALWDLKARKLNVPIWQLLGGKVRDRVSVYAWIGGDRPSDVESAAKERIAQGFKAIKMNATEDVGWLDSPGVLQASVERLKTVKALGIDAGVDFHGRLHRPMAKQLAKALEPHGPLFIEEPLLSEHPESIKELYGLTTCPIALGERLYSRWDFKRFFEDCSVDIIQPGNFRSLLHRSSGTLTYSPNRHRALRRHLRASPYRSHGGSIRRRSSTTLPSWAHRSCSLSPDRHLHAEPSDPGDECGDALQRRGWRV